MAWKPKKTKKLFGKTTVGFFNDILNTSFATALLQGVTDILVPNQVNILCFPGGTIRDIDKTCQQPEKIVYELANEQNVDALIMMAGSVGAFIGKEAFLRFCSQFKSLPLVAIGWELEGIPSVVINYKRGMYDAIMHLIKIHSYRNIAFIRGPKNDVAANQRYEGYLQAFNDGELPINEQLIIGGTYREDAGLQAVIELLDKRKQKPEAIVASNDDMALGAMRALLSRGLHIPSDIAVVGFDNRRRGRSMIPSLTTVDQDFYTMGKEAAKIALDLIKGETVEELVVQPAQLLIRESCGCQLPTLMPLQSLPGSIHANNPNHLSQVSDLPVLKGQVIPLLTEVFVSAQQSSPGIHKSSINQKIYKDWSQELFESLNEQLAQQDTYIFIVTLKRLVAESWEHGFTEETWHQILIALRNYLIPRLNPETMIVVDTYLTQGNTWFDNIINRNLQKTEINNINLERNLRYFRENLSTVFTIPELMDLIAEDLPLFAIPSCFIVLYENTDAPTTWAHLVFAYHTGVQLDLPAEGKRFPTNQILPFDFLPININLNLIIQSMHFGDKQLGYVIFEATAAQGEICDSLRIQMSDLINSLFMIKQEENRTQQLQVAAEISTTLSAILNLEELLPKIVAITCKRFHLYHVQVYLISEKDEQLYLAATTNTNLHSQVEKQQPIPLEKSGVLIGRVVKNHSYALDNAIEPTHGLLEQLVRPQTKSQLVIPLHAGERLIGVLDLHADITNGFSQEDIHIQKTLAAHISIAIQNANLYQDLKKQTEKANQAKRELEIMNKELEQLSLTASESDNAVIIMDIQGNVEWINKSFTRIYGLTLTELLAQKGNNLRNIRDGTQVDPHMQECIRYKKTVSFEFMEKNTQGQTLWILSTLSPVIDKHQNVTKLIAIDSDLTELRKAQQKEKEQAHSAGMAELAIEVAHNMGNVLNSVNISAENLQTIAKHSTINRLRKANSLLLSNLDSLESFILEDPRGKKLMEYYLVLGDEYREEHLQIKQLLERFKKKTDALIGFTKSHERLADKSLIVKEKIQLFEVIDEVLAESAADLSNLGIKVEQHSVFLPSLSMQYYKFKKIVQNLVVNAQEALTEVPKRQRFLRIMSEMQKNAVLRIIIEDTGCGILEEHLNYIFQQGFSTKPNHNGFGLHDSANYMAEIGGKISVHSVHEGKGARFVLTFPLKQN